MQPEEYDEYGEIIPKPSPREQSLRLSADQEHRIHQTKDLFMGDCSYCQSDMKKHIKTYWVDDD